MSGPPIVKDGQETIPVVRRLKKKDIRRARRKVASMAKDVADARLLLDMLGIREEP